MIIQQNSTKIWKSFLKLLSPTLIILSSVPVQVSALPTSGTLLSLKFPPETDRGAPTRTAGGGTRGDEEQFCTDGKTPLTAFMPTRKNVGITTASNPTFLFYIPKTTAKVAEFVLVTEGGEDIYITNFNLPENSGIVQFELPENIALQPNQYNQWQLALICNPKDRSDDEFIQGFIQRTELSEPVKQRLETADLVEQAEIYAQEKVWNETIQIMAQLRDSQPAAWKELLKSVGLEKFVSEPFVPCCSAQTSLNLDS